MQHWIMFYKAFQNCKHSQLFILYFCWDLALKIKIIINIINIDAIFINIIVLYCLDEIRSNFSIENNSHAIILD